MLSHKLLTPCLALAACGLVSACGEEAVRPAIAPELEAIQAESVIYGFEHLLTKEGVREAIAFADEAFVFGDSTVVHLRGNVRLVTYNSETGLQIAEVTSEWGHLNTSTNALIARGNAVLILEEEARRVESPELHYSPESNRIWSDSTSTMFTDDRIVEGSGFDSDLQFRKPTIRDARTRPR